jgi:hypothetical protein
LPASAWLLLTGRLGVALLCTPRVHGQSALPTARYLGLAEE